MLKLNTRKHLVFKLVDPDVLAFILDIVRVHDIPHFTAEFECRTGIVSVYRDAAETVDVQQESIGLYFDIHSTVCFRTSSAFTFFHPVIIDTKLLQPDISTINKCPKKKITSAAIKTKCHIRAVS